MVHNLPECIYSFFGHTLPLKSDVLRNPIVQRGNTVPSAPCALLMPTRSVSSSWECSDDLLPTVEAKQTHIKQSLKNSLEVAVNGVNAKKKDKLSQTEKKIKLIHNVIALPSSDLFVITPLRMQSKFPVVSADEIDNIFGDDF